jgi:hypothetical protein
MMGCVWITDISLEGFGIYFKFKLHSKVPQNNTHYPNTPLLDRKTCKLLFLKAIAILLVVHAHTTINR